MKQPSYLVTPNSIIVHNGQQTFTLQRNTTKGDQVVALIKAKKWDDLIELLTPAKALPVRTGGLFTVGEDGQLYAMGDTTPIHNVIGKRLLTFLQEGLPCEALVNFWNNLKKNPSARSIDQLYQFLEANHHPITEDGCFLAYKKVTKMPDGSLKDSHSRTFKNDIGTTVKMARDKVNPDPNQTCSAGLHVASFEYAQGFSGDVLVVVKVNPRDVVAVPTDYNKQKMRTCQYDVMEHYGQKVEMKEQLAGVDAKIKPSKREEVKQEAKKSQVVLKSLTAREIIQSVQKNLKNNSLNDANLKNKQSILNKATKLFESKGWRVL